MRDEAKKRLPGGSRQVGKRRGGVVVGRRLVAETVISAFPAIGIVVAVLTPPVAAAVEAGAPVEAAEEPVVATEVDLLDARSSLVADASYRCCRQGIRGRGQADPAESQ
jgi:hypothetical protein